MQKDIYIVIYTYIICNSLVKKNKTNKCSQKKIYRLFETFFNNSYWEIDKETEKDR